MSAQTRGAEGIQQSRRGSAPACRSGDGDGLRGRTCFSIAGSLLREPRPPHWMSGVPSAPRHPTQARG